MPEGKKKECFPGNRVIRRSAPKGFWFLSDHAHDQDCQSVTDGGRCEGRLGNLMVGQNVKSLTKQFCKLRYKIDK